MRRRSQLGRMSFALATCGALCASAHAIEAPLSTSATFESRSGATHALLEQARHDLKRADLHSARHTFEAVVAALDRDDAVDHAALVAALTGLASSLNALHEHEAAIAPARRALAYLRSRQGLYAPEQRALLELLIDAQSQIGSIEAASDDLKFLERVSAASAHTDPSRHASMLTSIADWHCRLGAFFAGRERHRRAIALLEDGGADKELLSARITFARCALHELSSRGIRTSGGVFEEYRGPIQRAASFNADGVEPGYRVRRGLRSEAEHAVRDAARLASTSSTLEAQEKVDALLFAGDWFQLKGFVRTARNYYVQAAKLLPSVTKADERLAAPVRVLYAIPPRALRAFRTKPPAGDERFIVVEFTVRADGSVQTPRVRERNVTKSMADETLDALRTARFRPRVIDGEPVESRNVVLRQSFDDPRELSRPVAYSNAE